MAFEAGLKILEKMKADLATFTGKEMNYDEAPLETGEDDQAYTDALAQAIWNIADHLSKGMKQGNLLGYVAAQQISWTERGTIFKSLKYLHRATKINDLSQYKWVPEIINDKTYQLGLAFRTCLAELIEREEAIKPLLEITVPFYGGKRPVPLEQMSWSLEARLQEYKKSNPEVEALPLIFEPDDDAQDDKLQETGVFDGIEDEDEDEQIQQQKAELEDAENRIREAEDAIKDEDPDIDLDEKTLQDLLVAADQRRRYLNEVSKRLRATEAKMGQDLVPNQQGEEIFIGLLECDENTAENCRVNIQAMRKRWDEKNNSTAKPPVLWLVETVITGDTKEVIQEVSAMKDWVVKKRELFTAINNKKDQIEAETAIDIRTPANNPPDTTHLPVDNLYTLQDRYQAEYARLQQAKKSNLSKKLDAFKLSLANINYHTMRLQFKLFVLKKIQGQYTRSIEGSQRIDDKLRLIRENIEELEKFINGDGSKQTPELDCEDLKKSITLLRKEITSYAQDRSAISDRQKPLQVESLALQTKINNAAQQLEEHQSNIVKFKKQCYEMEEEKLNDIEKNSRLATTPQSTPEEQLETIELQLAKLKKNRQFFKHMKDRASNIIIHNARILIDKNKRTLNEKKTELELIIVTNKRTQLIAQFFGEHLEDDLKKNNVNEDNEGAFTSYLKKRKVKYATRDWYSLAFATVFGVFGYTSECTEREKYIIRLNTCAKEYLNNPTEGYKPLKDLLKEGQRPGLLRPLFFSSRSAEGNDMFHKDSLQHQLKQFSDKFRAIEKRVNKKVAKVGAEDVNGQKVYP